MKATQTIVLTVLCTLLASTGVCATSQLVLDFDTTEGGALPTDFSTALTGGGGPVRWMVKEDASAPSGGKVLAQTSTDTTDYRFPLCVYEKLMARDIEVAVRFKAVSGSVDQAAGLVVRFQDKDNYYIVRANALENNVVLYKVKNGKRTDLKPIGTGPFAYGKKASVPHGQWNELHLTVTGKRFDVALNGQHLFAVDDETFPQAGKVGLWTKADSVTYFDNLTIESHDDGGK